MPGHLRFSEHVENCASNELTCQRFEPALHDNAAGSGWHVAAVIFMGAMELEDQLEADFVCKCWCCKRIYLSRLIHHV